MITAINLTSGGDSDGGSGSTTASITPSSNRLILLSVSSRTNITTDPVEPTATGNGLTWVSVGTVVFDATSASRRRITLFRAMGAVPTTGTISIDFAGQAQTAVGWSVDEIRGVDISGTNGSGAIVQSATNSATPPATSLTVTLGAFSSTNNATYGAFGQSNLQDRPVSSPGTGFTLLSENGVNTLISNATEFRPTNDTSVDITYTDPGGGTEIGGIAVELKATNQSGFFQFM